jgi:hypothetical protein
MSRDHQRLERPDRHRAAPTPTVRQHHEPPDFIEHPLDVGDSGSGWPLKGGAVPLTSYSKGDYSGVLAPNGGTLAGTAIVARSGRRRAQPHLPGRRGGGECPARGGRIGPPIASKVLWAASGAYDLLLSRNRPAGIDVGPKRDLNHLAECCDQYPATEGEIMHGHLETAGAAATSIPLSGAPADETTHPRASTAGTAPMNEALELAFDMVGVAIGAFIDSLS